MKCVQCGTQNEPQNKFCIECGTALVESTAQKYVIPYSRLVGQEVPVLFLFDELGRIAGIVNPSQKIIDEHKMDGVLQKVVILEPTGQVKSKGSEIDTLLTFIQQSKEFLGEKYNADEFSQMSPGDLKKVYLHLFEQILEYKSKRQNSLKSSNS